MVASGYCPNYRWFKNGSKKQDREEYIEASNRIDDQRRQDEGRGYSFLG